MWRFENKEYDLTKFIHLHPGGTEHITSTKGCDITHIVKVIHPDFKYIKGIITRCPSKCVTEDRDESTGKYTGLFDEINALTPNNRAVMRWPLIPFLTFLSVSVSVMLYSFYLLHHSTWFNPFYIIFSGVSIVIFSARIFHEGSHGTLPITEYFDFHRITPFITVGMVNNFCWNLQHILLHHSETNYEGFDQDMCDGTRWRLYTHWMSIFKMTIGMTLLNALGISKTSVHMSYISWVHILGQLFTSYLLGLYIGWLNLFLVICTTGGYFSYAAVLSHAQPECKIKEKYTICPDDWMADQIMTTCNYGSVGSPIENFFGWYMSFGLSNQIEHHVLPCVSHYYYKDLAPKVEAITKKYNLPYHNKPLLQACRDYNGTVK